MPRTRVDELEEGYYWARCHVDGTKFIVVHEEGLWYTFGIGHPINFDTRDIICPVKPIHDG